ncbi:LINE-1 retrotransposable element ORF2 protein, partial [Geodia barretti]
VNETTFEGSTILEGWAQYFENLGASSIPPAEDLACRLEIFQLFQSLPDVEPDLICAVEVGTLISSLPKGKAAGPDYLSNEHLIFSHPIIANTLEILFNAILISGHIPSIFHQGLIVPIPKRRNSDLSNPSNFRGITLLSVSSKVFEKLILTRLSTKSPLIHPLQGSYPVVT